MTYRSLTLVYYPAVAQFWQTYYKFGVRDGEVPVRVFLSKNEGLSMVAELDGEIVGTCLGSFDGRKGYVQKVAVRPDLQGKGVGRCLVEETLRRMREVGAVDFRVDCDESVAKFYESCGFKRYEIASLRIKEY